ncbi:MAG: molybdate ABC transporter substrate-binding protein [Thermomicrobiales bacterium]|nr:molybdate ABC transporter substrate-binding protein [Thermomicrobiales bacterium]
MRGQTRRSLLALAAALATLLVPGAMQPTSGARAQGSAIACPAPAAASPASSAAATPAPLDVAFPTSGGDLTVFAAASLTDAFGKMKGDLEAAHQGLTITYNFAGSQALVTQLAEGARADVFASANTSQMNAAMENGSITGEPRPFVHNLLVIVTPADNPAGIATPADLAKEGLRLVLAQPEVPVGKYSREAICTMGHDAATFGNDFVSRVAANIVSEEEDVRDVLTKVQLGEADAGIVYVSDASIAGDQVARIAIPDNLNVIATYPIAAVAGGNEALADAFIAYVLSPDGQKTLEEFGFAPIS